MSAETDPRILPAVRRLHARLEEVRTEVRTAARKAGPGERGEVNFTLVDSEESITPKPHLSPDEGPLSDDDSAPSSSFIVTSAGTVLRYGEKDGTEEPADETTQTTEADETSEQRCPMCEQPYEGALGTYRGFDMCTVCIETLQGRHIG